MTRLLALVATFILLLSVAAGSVLHAAEPQELAATSSVAAAVVVTADHTPGDADQVPADADKGVPHHHGGCHGDHVAAPIGHVRAAGVVPVRSAPFAVAADVRPRGTADPALRPPQA